MGPSCQASALTSIAGQHTHRHQPRARWTSASPGWELQGAAAALGVRCARQRRSQAPRAQLHMCHSVPPLAFPSASRRRAPTEKAVDVAPRLRRRNVAGDLVVAVGGACFVSGVHLLSRHRSVLGPSSCCGEGRVFVPLWRSLRERIAQLRMHLRCSRLERDRRAGEQASTRDWTGCPIWQAMRRFSSLSPSLACVLGLCFPDTASHVCVYGLGALG